ncbi:MAG: hypothetical protein WED07_13065 [Candidatus Freyarchaeum deiterrae]
MTVSDTLKKIFTIRRTVMIILAILIGVVSWLNYWQMFLDGTFSGPLAALWTFTSKNGVVIYNGALYSLSDLSPLFPGVVFPLPFNFFVIPENPTFYIQDSIQGYAPILLFLVASIGNGLPDGILDTAFTAGFFALGRHFQDVILMSTLQYTPLRGWTWAIVVTMGVFGLIGGFFAQFQVYQLMWRSFLYSFRKLKVVITWLFFLLAPFAIGYIVDVKSVVSITNIPPFLYISPTQLQFGPWTIYFNEVLMLCFVYAFVFITLVGFFSKRFWSGALIGASISLAAFVGILRTQAPQLIHDLLWLPYYIAIQGNIVTYSIVNGIVQADLSVAYTAMAAVFIVISALWGGFWASMGRVSSYTEPTPELKTPHDLAYIFRDLWSNYFLFGKNVVAEFKKVKGAGAGLRGIFGGHAGYETYEHMDRIEKGGKTPMPEPELEIVSQEENKCKVRVKSTGEEIGSLYDPNYLLKKYKPAWNPFELAHQVNVVKSITPLVAVIIAVATIFFFVNISGHLGDLTSPDPQWRFFTTGEVRLLVGAALVLYAIIILFSIYWGLKSRRILQESPEGAPSVIAIGVFSAIAFIFSEYILLRLADFLGVNILNSPFFRQFVLGETWTQATTTPSLLDQYTMLAAVPFNSAFTANLYGIIFLLAAAFILAIAGVQVLGFERINLYFYASEGPLFPYKNREDAPLWVEGKYYWVMRFTYVWPGEFTVASRQLYHEDYERAEVWVNAETGVPEWIVSDYHWRELFYRVPDDGKDHKIIVDFNTNFHTPDFILLHPKDLEGYKVEDPIQAAFSMSRDSLNKLRKRTGELFKHLEDRISKTITSAETEYAVKTKSEYVENYLVDLAPGVRRVAANVCAKMPWSFWRYPLGVPTVDEKTDKYQYRQAKYIPPKISDPLYPIKRQIDGDGTAAVVNQQVCANCSTLNTIDLKSSDAKNWQCKKCGKDMRKQSLLHKSTE